MARVVYARLIHIYVFYIFMYYNICLVYILYYLHQTDKDKFSTRCTFLYLLYDDKRVLAFL